jgi:DNA-binding MarR family transcriptional regulator
MKKNTSSRLAVASSDSPASHDWTFLTNHAHVLWCICQEPESRLRDIAQAVGITERMVHRIVTELAEEGYLVVEKQGRRNVYHVQGDHPLRHPLESHCQVGQLLNLLKRTHR